MPLAFDVFTKKTRLFYIAEVISIITVLVIAWGYYYNIQFKTVFMPLIDALLILGALVTIGFACVAGTGLVRTYVKDGELVFGDDYIIIDELKVSLGEAEKISLNLAIRNVKHMGYLLGNRIWVTGKDGKMHKNRFAIKTRDQNNDLEALLKQWQSAGVKFDLSYHQAFT